MILGSEEAHVSYHHMALPLWQFTDDVDLEHFMEAVAPASYTLRIVDDVDAVGIIHSDMPATDANAVAAFEFQWLIHGLVDCDENDTPIEETDGNDSDSA